MRKKQGGSQSSRDNKGNAPSSMGASLRRHNETRFKEVWNFNLFIYYFF